MAIPISFSPSEGGKRKGVRVSLDLGSQANKLQGLGFIDNTHPAANFSDDGIVGDSCANHHTLLNGGQL